MMDKNPEGQDVVLCVIKQVKEINPFIHFSNANN